MDNEQILRIQKKFARFHKLLVFLIVIFNIERIIHGPVTVISVLPSIVALLLLAAEEIILIQKNFKMGWLPFLRYAQVLCAMVFMLKSQSLYAFGLCLVCISLFTAEYYLTYDFVDGYYRVVFILTIGIPFEILALLGCVLESKLDERIFPLTVLIAVFVTVTYWMAMLFAQLILESNEKVYAQSRLIERVNETNEELRINQEKVKKANDMLGVQKIKLEAAYNKINSVNSEMMIQNDIIKYISSSLDISKLMTLITESILSEIGVDVCTIVLYPSATEDKRSSFKIRTRLSAAFTEHLSESIRDRCFTQYLSLDGTYVDNHVDERKYSFIKKGLIGSLIIVPLIKNGAITGCLFVGHPKYEYFCDNIGFFEGIVAQFMVALDNANLYAKMESMAIRDGLTGIYNRRHLTDLFNDALNEAIICKTPLTVALFDIDHFKNVNDTYGHLFGDVVIQTIARLAADIAEEYDGIVGRYGGEEFVIIFQGMNLKNSYEPVSMLHDGVKKLGLVQNGQKVTINVSVGLTSYPETCRNPGDLLNRADWAMYYSKQNGRDQITIDSDAIREQVMLK